MSNALRAVPEGGACRRWARELEGEGVLALKVTDNGPGIDAELAGRLFEPFSHRRAAGRRLSIAGLGLAISRAIVEGARRHAALRARSGRRFHFYGMPAPAGAGRRNTGGGLAVTGDDSGLSVLVVDDDAAILRTLLLTLKSLGCRVVGESGGEAALAAVEENRRPICC